jgi:hypothetical protein
MDVECLNVVIALAAEREERFLLPCNKKNSRIRFPLSDAAGHKRQLFI